MSPTILIFDDQSPEPQSILERKFCYKEASKHLDHFPHPARQGEILGAGGGGQSWGGGRGRVTFGWDLLIHGQRWMEAGGKGPIREKQEVNHELAFWPSLSREWSENGLGDILARGLKVSVSGIPHLPEGRGASSVQT